MKKLIEEVESIAVQDLQEALHECGEEIAADIVTIRENRDDDDESPLKMTLSFAIVVNLDKSTVDTALSWSIKKKRKESTRLDLDETPKFPGLDVEITSHNGEKP